jgi:decaprenylphospho-beta-D-ribofuranose 2-oxidase
MGLTGHILDVTFRMQHVPSPSIVETATAFPDLESLISGLERASESSPFTVAWCDLLARRSAFGRGVLLCGRWAGASEAAAFRPRRPPRIRIPAALPAALLTNASVGAFGALHYELARHSAAYGVGAPTLRSTEGFFYPLDRIGDWNLLYGRRGLTQYQCVLPKDASMRSYRRLAEVARSGGPGPFLSVIKDCGAEGKGLLSFPMPGISFALDFPVHAGTPDLVARLGEVVIAAGGRIYLAKDAFTSARQFEAMEPRLAAFLELRRRIDPDGRLGSALAERLFP